MNGTTRIEPPHDQPLAQPVPARVAVRPQAARQQVGGRGRTPLMLLRLMVWSVLHFVFYFLQQLAELLAPLLLVAGIGWWALPKIVGAITTGTGLTGTGAPANTDSQARDILNTISGTIPTGIHIAGHWITAVWLVMAGLLLMAVAAIGATLSALAAREM
ncbi:hypothetical protein [Lichenicola sp.]|uniref:hypothetical protein n=1 Tax=Lichenicola sp. TaxID=2804529 RepID=UPI003AFFF0CE